MKPCSIGSGFWPERQTTVSAVATDLLDKALPRFRVEREG
jgi:hypothetical protein